MSIKFETLTLPAHWACYLVNGDASYLNDSEVAVIDAFADTFPAFHVTDVSEEAYFSRYHDADNGEGLLTEVAEYTVQTAY